MFKFSKQAISVHLIDLSPSGWVGKTVRICATNPFVIHFLPRVCVIVFHSLVCLGLQSPDDPQPAHSAQDAPVRGCGGIFRGGEMTEKWENRTGDADKDKDPLEPLICFAVG